MPNTLVLLTAQFPYGKSETFLENELPYLAEAFSQVYIITLNNGDIVREIPPNVKVLNIGEDFENSYTSFKSIKYLTANILRAFVQEYRSSSSKTSSKIELLSYMLRLNYKAMLLKVLLTKYKIPANVVFYAYWFEEWATILSLLKKIKVVDKFHARVHGFDLYEDRAIYNFIPFRDLQLEQVATVSAVSEAGYKYLIGKHPYFQEKFLLHRLGVQDYGIGPFGFSQNFIMVSCSNIIPLKRVHLIVEILTHIRLPVKWVHFGDGTLLMEVIEMAERLPENIMTEFRGRVSNQDLISFYKSNKVDLFITTSESEGGCPVSIQEAISFGIPVLGTAVGGVPEIVNNETGILIDKDFGARDVARLIEDFLQSNKNSIMFREQVRRFWTRKFMAEVNFKRYIDEVLRS